MVSAWTSSLISHRVETPVDFLAASWYFTSLAEQHHLVFLTLSLFTSLLQELHLEELCVPQTSFKANDSEMSGL